MTLEDNVLENISVGDRVIIEPRDSNMLLDDRIIDKLKAGNRVNTERKWHGRKIHRSKISYRRNDLPRTYLLADALLKEVGEFVQQKETEDYATGYVGTSESLQAEHWNPYTNSEIGGTVLSDRDKELLRELFKNDFVPLGYAGSVYFVSERLLDNEDVSDNFIRLHGLDEVISKLEKHLDLEIVMPAKNLPDSNAKIIVVYGRHPEKQSVLPMHEAGHTSLLMANTCESAGNGYGSIVPDELVKGGDRYLKHLPSPGEMAFSINSGRNKGYAISDENLVVQKQTKPQQP